MNRKEPLGIIILAAGKGTRMKSTLPKVLHPLSGRPLLAYVLDTARGLHAERIVVVVGHRASLIRAAFPETDLIFVEQTRRLGTGHAVRRAEKALADFPGRILILCGDVPLLTEETLSSFLGFHQAKKATVSLLTTVLEDPSGYGRVLRNPDGTLARIVEDRDAGPDEKSSKEINTGVYCVERDFLFSAVSAIKRGNAQKEYYLTDIIEIGARRGVKMAAFVVPDCAEALGINSPEDLAGAALILEARRHGP